MSVNADNLGGREGLMVRLCQESQEALVSFDAEVDMCRMAREGLTQMEIVSDIRRDYVPS